MGDLERHEKWVPSADIADYAIKRGISKEPVFAWWVPYVVRKSNRIIAKMKNKYWERTHKYGIKIPKDAAEAYAIDRETATPSGPMLSNKKWVR